LISLFFNTRFDNIFEINRTMKYHSGKLLEGRTPGSTDTDSCTGYRGVRLEFFPIANRTNPFTASTPC
jgi:hypothetical protein